MSENPADVSMMPSEDVTTPAVTVLIPAFNAAGTIRRAFNSVLAQTYDDYEIVIVDDGSRDSTAEIVTAYHNDKVRLLRLAQIRARAVR